VYRRNRVPLPGSWSRLVASEEDGEEENAQITRPHRGWSGRNLEAGWQSFIPTRSFAV
jgi:hypothetical protein